MSTASRNDPTPICLRLMRSHGRVAHAMLDVPARGAGLAAVLELDGTRLSEAQWRSANLCQLRPTGSAWQLHNDAPALVCSADGARVEAGAPASIAIGSWIEIGMLRLEVVAAAVRESAPPAPVPQRAAVPTASAKPLVDDVFDLRDLATPLEASPASSTRVDTFGVLDISGAEASATVDPLGSLLGEADQPIREAAQPFRIETQLAQAEWAPERPASSKLDASTPFASDDPSGQLLGELHAEFSRVVRDPHHLSGHTDWAGLLTPRGEQDVALEDLERDGAPFTLLRHILEPDGPIDSLIEGFDSVGRSTLLDADPEEDVLRLFAPELAHGARQAVPSLTRREHHELSPDSHVQLGAMVRREPT